jgi:hypothetical protein
MAHLEASILIVYSLLVIGATNIGLFTSPSSKSRKDLVH